MPQYVTYGAGTQLAELIDTERNGDTDGYRVLPLRDGAGNATTIWVPHVVAVEVEKWVPAGPRSRLFFRWHRSPETGQWRKQERPPEDIVDLPEVLAPNPREKGMPTGRAAERKEPPRMPITLLDYVIARVGHKASYSSADFHRCRVSMVGLCAGCACILTAVGAYPSTTGHVYCDRCIQDGGFATTAEFAEWLQDSSPESQNVVLIPAVLKIDAPCDADAAGAETATHLVYTRSGPLQLCGHHMGVHELVIVASAYPTESIAPEMAPENFILSRPRHES